MALSDRGDAAGGKTHGQLLAQANSGEVGIREDRYCEACFYIGQKYLLSNDKENAADSFRKSPDEEVIPFTEHNFALHEPGRKKAPKKESGWDFCKHFPF